MATRTEADTYKKERCAQRTLIMRRSEVQGSISSIGETPVLPMTAASVAGSTANDFARLLEASSECFIQIDERGMVIYANAATRRELGLADAFAPSPHWQDLLEPPAVGGAHRGILRSLLRGGHWEGELVLQVRGACDVPYHLVAASHRAEDGRVVRYSMRLRNVAAERQARLQILRQTDILQAITEAIPSTVVVVDTDGRYRFANRAFERYSGHDRDRIIGRRVADVLGEEELARRKPFMVRAYAGESVEFVLDYPDEHGTRWLALSCIPVRVDGVVDGFVGISQDVTRDRRERDRLTRLAERDSLTGLLNRTGFESNVERLRARGDADGLALLYVDLDHFKPINDSRGHLAGDKLLQLFAQRLLRVVRTTDVVARIGGDEFAILLPGMHDLSQADLVADKVLTAAREPFLVGGFELRVTASVGIAVGLETAAGWHELVARADAMLYRAKAQGRDCVAGAAA